MKEKKIKKLIDWLIAIEFGQWSVCSQDGKYKVLYIVIPLYFLKTFIQENDLNFTGRSFTDSLDGMKPEGDNILFTCPIE